MNHFVLSKNNKKYYFNRIKFKKVTKLKKGEKT